MTGLGVGAFLRGFRAAAIGLTLSALVGGCGDDDSPSETEGGRGGGGGIGGSLGGGAQGPGGAGAGGAAAGDAGDAGGPSPQGGAAGTGAAAGGVPSGGHAGGADGGDAGAPGTGGTSGTSSGGDHAGGSGGTPTNGGTGGSPSSGGHAGDEGTGGETTGGAGPEGGGGGEGGDGGAGGGSGSIELHTPSLWEGLYGKSYYRRLKAEGGDANTLSFSIASGSLPQGLRLSRRGVLNGVPREEGTFTFKVSVSDAAGATGSSSDFSLRIRRHRWICYLYYWQSRVEPYDSIYQWYRFDSSTNAQAPFANGCQFSPGGGWFRETGGLRDATTPAPGPLVSPGCDGTWSQDERRLACLTTNTIDIVEFDPVLTTRHVEAANCSGGAWSPTALRFASVCAGTVRVNTLPATTTEAIPNASIVAWVSDDVLMVRTAQGALATARFAGNTLQVTERLSDASRLGSTLRVDAGTNRALFLGGTAPTATAFFDFETGYFSSADVDYSEHLEHFFRRVTAGSTTNIELHATDDPNGSPLATLPILQGSPAIWSPDGNVLVTTTQDGSSTRYSDFIDGLRTRQFALTTPLLWGEADRWLLANDVNVGPSLLNLVPAALEATSGPFAEIRLMPSKTGLYIPGSWLDQRICTISVTDAGSEEPRCVPPEANAFFDSERPHVWSSDSRALLYFTPNTGPLNDLGDGLGAMDVVTGTSQQLVVAYTGISFEQGLDVGPLSQP